MKIFSMHFWEARWGDLGCAGEWSERPIRLYASPIMDPDMLLRARGGLLGFGNFKDTVTQLSDDAAVLTSIAEDTGAMGLGSIGYRTDKVCTLEIAPQGSSKFASATAENAWDGSYPLTGIYYLVLNHDLQGNFELDPLRREFLRYILSREGQQAAVAAGYVPLSAEIARRSLAQVHLTPSGEGSWDRLIRRLRARQPPREPMNRIQRRTQEVGDRPTDEQLGGLAAALIGTGLTSSVTFETDDEGAVVKYRLLGRPEAMSTDHPTPEAEATVPIGLYCVWTEREGTATSPPDAWFEVIQEQERIKICEARTDFRGEATRLLRITREVLSEPLCDESDAPHGWTLDAQQRMVKWCGRLLSRVEAREAIDFGIVLRDLERDFDSLGIDGGTRRDWCISIVMELKLRRETEDESTGAATD